MFNRYQKICFQGFILTGFLLYFIGLFFLMQIALVFLSIVQTFLDIPMGHLHDLSLLLPGSNVPLGHGFIFLGEGRVALAVGRDILLLE